MESTTNNESFKARVLERLHDPVQLRVLVTAVVLLVGYAGIYLPLNADIEDTSRQLAAEQKRLELARTIERLDAEYEKVRQRVAPRRETTEWWAYVQAGMRRFPGIEVVELTKDSEVRTVGPYKAVVLRMELKGPFRQLDSFLRWLETDERLFRVDHVGLQPATGPGGHVTMKLTVLGLMG